VAAIGCRLCCTAGSAAAGTSADVTKAIGPQLGRSRDVRRRYPARATNLLGYCFGEDRLAVLRLQVPVGKAQNLKTAGITDDPEIQLVPFPVSGRNFHKARQPSLLFDGSIDFR